MERLQLGLDEAYGLQPHNKLAEAFGNVVSAIQVRRPPLHWKRLKAKRTGGDDSGEGRGVVFPHLHPPQPSKRLDSPTLNSYQAPAELIGGTLSAAAGHVTGAIQTAGGALMAGGGAIVSGALLPAQQGIKQAFKKIQDKVAEPLRRK